MSTPHRPQRSQEEQELPEAPAWFNKQQRKKYRELGRKVVAMGIWQDTDYDSFCILVDNLVGYEQASSMVARDGVMVPGRGGKMVRNPATIARNACWSNIQPLLTQFGLTPSARAQMGITSKTVSSIDKFLPTKLEAVQ